MIYTVTLNPALDKTVTIPSFTPGRVNRVASMRQDPGGKGINVSKVVQKLGANSLAMGILGGSSGIWIEENLRKQGIPTQFVFADCQTRTNLKIIDSLQQVNTDINEAGFPVSEMLLKDLKKLLLTQLQEEDLVVFSGSLPPDCPKEIYRDWILACKERGAKTILDADGEALAQGLTAAPYLIKPNHHELAALVGKEQRTVEETGRTAKELMEQYQVEKMVVSMGAHGAIYLAKEEAFYVESLKVPVGSTVGAGDSLVAAMAVAEERKLSLMEAARLSAAVAAANVMCSGSQAAEYEQVLALLPQVHLTNYSSSSKAFCPSRQRFC